MNHNKSFPLHKKRVGEGFIIWWYNNLSQRNKITYIINTTCITIISILDEKKKKHFTTLSPKNKSWKQINKPMHTTQCTHMLHTPHNARRCKVLYINLPWVALFLLLFLDQLPHDSQFCHSLQNHSIQLRIRMRCLLASCFIYVASAIGSWNK